MSDGARQAPATTATQVISAGLASTVAAFLTSRFGVAGTLLGAALTSMIITGGSAILQAHFRNVSSRVKARRDQRKTGHSAQRPAVPGRPDLRDNFMGRMRAALDRFAHLPLHTRRSILLKGLVAAAVAFVIGMGAIYAVEKVIGNSLSCGLWGNCPEGATPGIHTGGGDGAGAQPTIKLGRVKSDTATPQNGTQSPGIQQNTAPPEQQGTPRVIPDSRPDQDPSLPEPREPVQPRAPQEEPVVPGEEPVVTPGSGGQPPQRQNPSEGGASAPSQQTPPGGDRQQPARSQ